MGESLEGSAVIEGLRRDIRWLKGYALAITLAIAILALTGITLAGEVSTPLVRIAELTIDPAQIENYKAAVREEMKTAVRVEPGVLAIYAVALKEDSASLRFFEIYADEAAYKAHIASAHFRKYVETTKKMILSRKLIETDPIQLSAKLAPQ